MNTIKLYRKQDGMLTCPNLHKVTLVVGSNTKKVHWNWFYIRVPKLIPPKRNGTELTPSIRDPPGRGGVMATSLCTDPPPPGRGGGGHFRLPFWHL